MSWLGSNWIWVAVAVGAFAFFAFGRSRCGIGHGRHDQRRQLDSDQTGPTQEPRTSPISTAPASGGSKDSVRPGDLLHDAEQPMAGALTAQSSDEERASDPSGPHRHRHGC
jgi:hypothetical protein